MAKHLFEHNFCHTRPVCCLLPLPCSCVKSLVLEVVLGMKRKRQLASTLENVSLLVYLGLETKKTHLLNIVIFILVDQSVDYKLQKFLYRGW